MLILKIQSLYRKNELYSSQLPYIKYNKIFDFSAMYGIPCSKLKKILY